MMKRVPVAMIDMARVEINKRHRISGHLPYCFVFSVALVHGTYLQLNLNISTKLQRSRQPISVEEYKENRYASEHPEDQRVAEFTFLFYKENKSRYFVTRKLVRRLKSLRDFSGIRGEKPQSKSSLTQAGYERRNLAQPD